MTSYRKLKEENKLLKRQLYTIANNPDSVESQALIALYKFSSDIRNMIMFGSPKNVYLYNEYELINNHESV